MKNNVQTKKANMETGGVMKKVTAFFRRNKRSLCAICFCLLMVGMMAGNVVHAEGEAVGGAEELWDTLEEILTTWVARLGGVIIFVGGIMFALGWKDDDAAGKSRGISTVISGAIVMALAGMASLFFF